MRIPVSLPARTAPAPKRMPPGADRYVEQVRDARPEPSSLHGIVFSRYPQGRYHILKFPNETKPDIPPIDIPQDAVKDGRVVISVNGIGQELGHHLGDIRRFLQASSARDHGANVGQPVIGVHEGVHKKKALDVIRIGADIGYMKLVQSRALPLRWLSKLVYRIDPTVKAVHDEVRQSLQAGRDVQLVVHSGGGAEAALALNILAREDKGRYRQDIADKVRVLALAPATSRKDFEKAGVQRDNILVTGSSRDPVYEFGRRYIEPALTATFLPALVAMGMTWAKHGPSPTHSLDYLFSANAAGGQNRLQRFLDGGPGGDYRLA